jgi:Arc/MetJ-type ribon-helix-helix transcriptional regulator
MSTTTVRLDPDEELTLDQLAQIHGGRSNALREGLKLLAASTQRHGALTELLRDWDQEAGPVDERSVAAMAERYDL